MLVAYAAYLVVPVMGERGVSKINLGRRGSPPELQRYEKLLLLVASRRCQSKQPYSDCRRAPHGRFAGPSQIVRSVSVGHQSHLAIARTPADCATANRGICPREAAGCVRAHHIRFDAVSRATRLSGASTRDTRAFAVNFRHRQLIPRFFWYGALSHSLLFWVSRRWDFTLARYPVWYQIFPRQN